MTILRKLDIKPESVESIYGYYNNKILLVNRKYQRKLVWSIEEKETFIDSISMALPIPLILVAVTKFKEKSVYEIIDGMQRLNAVVSFIENELSLHGKFFNLDTLALTKRRLDAGKLVQKMPKLSIEECLSITSYQLPFSITSRETDAEIEEIFRRINSYGKRLSSHELRQAGSTSTFTKIIRELSERIRGDVAPSDKILLGYMRKISINNKGLKYGIDLKDIFWYKQNILTENNIRASRDEELIAHLILAMITGYDVNISSTSLDRAYGISDEPEDNLDTENLIKKFGGEAFITRQFEGVFQEIQTVLSESKLNFRNHLFKGKSRYLNNAFQAIFLAFHNLLVLEQQKISNYAALSRELQGLGDTIITPAIDEIRHRAARRRCVDAICGVIRKHFVKRDTTDPALSNGVMKLESLLNAAKTENTSYDFKQGIYQLDKDEKDIKEKILKTLCSFVNLGRNVVGYVVIGVADKEETAIKFKDYYGAEALKVGNFFITGIEAESRKRNQSLDEYRTKLEQFIKTADIQPEYYKTQILKNIDLFTYRDRSIIILKIESADDPIKLNGKFFHRQGTSTEEIPSSQERGLWTLFLK